MIWSYRALLVSRYVSDVCERAMSGTAERVGLAPPLFWLIKLLFQFFSKVLHKKAHRVILSHVRTSEETLLFPDCSISIQYSFLAVFLVSE